MVDRRALIQQLSQTLDGALLGCESQLLSESDDVGVVLPLSIIWNPQVHLLSRLLPPSFLYSYQAFGVEGDSIQ